VYLETSAIVKNKTDNPIKAHLIDFSAGNLKKIELKQKEIFDTKCSDKLSEFKNIFKERFNKSAAKELFLNREVEDNRKILYLTPIQNLHFKNRTFIISIDDLIEMREYFNTQIVKGETYYGFIHSPNFKFQHEKETNAFVYAKVTYDYYNWLIKFQANYKLKINRKENETLVSKRNELKIDRIKVKVIALICIYNNIHITRLNCDEIAEKYHYTEKKSGEGLFQDYQKFNRFNARVKLLGESKIKCLNKLKLIENAINHLKGKAKENAKKDYEVLSNAIEDYEW
jgi:hypothetical protein